MPGSATIATMTHTPKPTPKRTDKFGAPIRLEPYTDLDLGDEAAVDAYLLSLEIQEREQKQAEDSKD